jgi:hypothetical protein
MCGGGVERGEVGARGDLKDETVALESWEGCCALECWDVSLQHWSARRDGWA